MYHFGYNNCTCGFLFYYCNMHVGSIYVHEHAMVAALCELSYATIITHHTCLLSCLLISGSQTIILQEREQPKLTKGGNIYMMYYSNRVNGKRREVIIMLQHYMYIIL